MKKNFFLTSLFFIILLIVKSQDIITLNTGEEIKVSITKIEDKLIIYKELDGINEVVNSINKDKVYSIDFNKKSTNSLLQQFLKHNALSLKTIDNEQKLFNEQYNEMVANITVLLENWMLQDTAYQNNLKRQHKEMKLQQETKDNQVNISNSDALVSKPFIDERDGKMYQTVKIGQQIWMAENLAYKTDIGCWAYDNNESNGTTYGYLYTWETAKKGCPIGWHLPTDAQWTTLTDELNGLRKAGTEMKSTNGWTDPKSKDIIISNSSGFSAIPGGYRDNNATFKGIGTLGDWWSCNEDENILGSVIARSMSNDYNGIARVSFDKIIGISVRCVKD